MILTPEQETMLNGSKGEVMAKKKTKKKIKKELW